MRGIRALLMLDLLRFKNFVKDVVRSPKRILIYLIQFVWYVFILIPVIINRGKTFNEISAMQTDIFNLVIIGIMLLMFFAESFSSLKQPGILLSPGDETFILASPIRERTVFFWHMIRGTFKYLLTSVMTILYLPFIRAVMKLSVYPQNLIFGYLGIFFFNLAFAPVRFFLYSISIKFNAKGKIKCFLWGFLILILSFAGFFAYKERNIYGVVEFFNLKMWDYVPIIGPSKGLILSYFTGSSHNVLAQIVLQVVTIGLFAFIALYFATDYYEEVTTYNEMIRKIRKKVEKGDFSDDGNKKAKKKVRKVELNFAPKGPWAFVWLKIVENKRSVGSVIFNLYNLILLVLSLLFGYFVPKDDSDVIFFVVFFYAYMTWILSGISAIAAELNKMYVYIIPGEGIKKLVAVNIIPLLKSFISAFLLILPASILIKPGLLNTVAGMMFVISFSILQNFSYAFINTFMPSKEDLKAVIVFFKLLGLLLLFFPVGLISIPVGVVTQNVGIGVLSASVMMLLEAGILLLFTNSIFERLELK